MIVVVEGPSASGKTTYATARGCAMVPENTGVAPPADASPPERAEFWAHQNSARWKSALEVEESVGRVVCDTDPLKLHYDYSLHGIGLLDRPIVLAGVVACRRAIKARTLGIADLVLCCIPEARTLAGRKHLDTTRSRRNFEINARLGAPLREWYQALDATDPGRVQWDFPEHLPSAPIRDRYDVDLFDAWMSSLGLTGGRR